MRTYCGLDADWSSPAVSSAAMSDESPVPIVSEGMEVPLGDDGESVSFVTIVKSAFREPTVVSVIALLGMVAIARSNGQSTRETTVHPLRPRDAGIPSPRSGHTAAAGRYRDCRE